MDKESQVSQNQREKLKKKEIKNKNCGWGLPWWSSS